MSARSRDDECWREMSRRARPCVARVFVCRRARATPPAHEAFSRTERRVARSVKKSTASSFTLQRARRDLKGAKVPRTCAVEKRSRAGFRPAAKCHRGGGTSKIDSQSKKQIQHDEKELAENLMIVDLMRNDLGKICKYGSINVNNLYNIDSFKTVHQMVSEVYGKLDSNITEIDVIKALFPGGSITGAPKESAMKIIDLLENYQRNIYTGSIGFINNKGDMDFNIAIRTMTVKNKNGSYPVGGGIVWDSNPLEEWQEAQLKSQILFPFNNKKNNMLRKINQRAIKCNQKI